MLHNLLNFDLKKLELLLEDLDCLIGNRDFVRILREFLDQVVIFVLSGGVEIDEELPVILICKDLSLCNLAHCLQKFILFQFQELRLQNFEQMDRDFENAFPFLLFECEKNTENACFTRRIMSQIFIRVCEYEVC